MPKPVCVKCSREMQPMRSGAVTFTALSVGGPYEQYQADLFRCPICGVEIMAGYGANPTWRHNQPAKPEIPIAIAYEAKDHYP